MKGNRKQADLTVRLPDYVQTLMGCLWAAGEEAYLVGGSLRDLLLGKEPHDYDLATSAIPKKTAAVFSHLRVIKTGMKHGTLTVLSEGNPVEITTFRVDGSYTDARHPDCVTFTDRLADDLSRRDFTVNAMAYHPRTGLVDLFGGREDLGHRILRAVGDPKERFSEDALRIMRAFRFSAQLGFSIEEKTLRGAADCREGLGRIATERRAAEFLRLLMSQDPSEALRAMRDTQILPYVAGDYTPSETILAALKHSEQEDFARLGLFFAEAEGEQMGKALHALKYSNKQITGACAVARGSCRRMQSPKDARQLIAETGTYAYEAAEASVLRGISPKEALVWVAENRVPCRIAELPVSGRELTELGLRGKEVGETLEELLKAVMEDPSCNNKETLLAMAREGLK